MYPLQNVFICLSPGVLSVRSIERCRPSKMSHRSEKLSHPYHFLDRTRYCNEVSTIRKDTISLLQCPFTLGSNYNLQNRNVPSHDQFDNLILYFSHYIEFI